MVWEVECRECGRTKKEIERQGGGFVDSIFTCTRCIALAFLRCKPPSDVNLSVTGLPPPMTPQILKDVQRFAESPGWWVRLLPKSDLDIWGLS
jgi:hypothetical protein